VDQRAEILASFGVAAGTASGGCAALIVVVICYRRKKVKDRDPLDLKLLRNESSAQNAADVNMLYENTPRNPLFRSADA